MKKVLTLILAFVLVIGATVAGTLAYLTSTDEVINTFTVGNVKITLDEADTDLNGEVIPNADRVKGNEYKLMPGHTYVKDPTVHIDPNSEDCYIRMNVKIENWNKLVERVGNPELLPEDLVGGWDSAYWTAYSMKVVEGNAYVEFRHADVFKNNETVKPLFETITLPDTVKDMTGLETVKIFVTADAIQADGFETANDAWTAFNAQ